jgi:hypothetical protein
MAGEFVFYHYMPDLDGQPVNDIKHIYFANQADLSL